MPHLRLIASLTHAFLTSLNSSSCLMVSKLVNLTIFFFPSHPHSIWISNLPHFFFFSPSRHLGLDLALCALLSASRRHQVLILFFWFWFWLLDSLSFIWSFFGSFFFSFHFSRLHLRVSVHVLDFILGSPFRYFTTKW